jgi:hypothetical protein
MASLVLDAQENLMELTANHAYPDLQEWTAQIVKLDFLQHQEFVTLAQLLVFIAMLVLPQQYVILVILTISGQLVIIAQLDILRQYHNLASYASI